jgi:hypothetical protein
MDINSSLLVSNSICMLRILNKRLHNNVDEKKEAVELNLHSLVVDFIQRSLPVSNHQV